MYRCVVAKKIVCHSMFSCTFHVNAWAHFVEYSSPHCSTMKTVNALWCVTMKVEKSWRWSISSTRVDREKHPRSEMKEHTVSIMIRIVDTSCMAALTQMAYEKNKDWCKNSVFQLSVFKERLKMQLLVILPK